MNTQDILKNLFASLAAVVVLAGCATPYHPNGFTGGYSETQLAPDVFRIVFRGNGYTSAERAQDFALLRASELTLQNGFTCFAVIDEQESTSVSSYTTPGHADTTAYGSGYSSGDIYLNPYGGSYSGTSSTYANATTTYTPPQTYVFYKPNTGLLIRAFRVKPNGIFTFDAAFLAQSLAQKYHIKLPSTVNTNLVSDSDVGFPNVQQTNSSSSATTNEAVIADLKAKAENGDADAQSVLGLDYSFGAGVPRNAVEAVKWFRKAAEQGDSVAQCSLGEAYNNGDGVPQDYAEAVKWYRKAAEQGFSVAQFDLGMCYYEGHGVPQDAVEAVKWVRRAAEQGYSFAQGCLGEAYNNGDGVRKDYVEAYKWLNLASAQGVEIAKEKLLDLEQHMTPEQIAEAQQLSREFTPHKETPGY